MFLNTFVMTFAPARSNAFALSYSQFVPGNTGMNTVGVPILWSQITMLSALNTSFLTSSFFTPLSVGNTSSRVASHVFNASSSVMETLPYSKAALSVTSPITR